MANDINNKEVGNRIRSIRKASGMTTDTFGDLFNPPASKGTVSKWENGHYLPNNERLVKIAEEGEISVDELLYGSKAEQIASILREELGEDANSKIIKDVIDFFEATGEEHSLNKENLVNAYRSYVSFEETSNQSQIDPTPPKYANRMFNSSELIQLLIEEISGLDDEMEVLEHELSNNKAIEESDYLALSSVLNDYGLYKIHLEKIIDNIKIPSQDFYVFEGVIYFAVEATNITLNSITFDVSKYDILTVYNEYGKIIELSYSLDAKKLLNVLNKYRSTIEDVYKIELTYIPTSLFTTDYELIKEPNRIQVISNKILNIPKV